MLFFGFEDPHFCVVYQLLVKDTLLQFLRVVDVVGDGHNRNRKINPLKIAFTTNCVTIFVYPQINNQKAEMTNHPQWTPTQLSTLDTHLKTHSYVCGHQPSKSDSILATSIGQNGVDLSTYVHVSRWFRHIGSFDHCELSGELRTVEDIFGSLDSTYQEVCILVQCCVSIAS